MLVHLKDGAKVIKFTNVSKTYKNGTVALKDVNLEIEDGEFVFVVGSSGAGKSTLIKMLLHEEIPTAGEVEVNGFKLSRMKRRQIPKFRRSLGVVFQDFRLIPTMNVFDNVAFALRVTDVSSRDVRRRVPYILGLVGLGSKSKCMPQQLSGGEQQRVALARALVNNPRLIIADEPTGNLDTKSGKDVMRILNELWCEGRTIILITHDNEIAHTARRIVKILDGKIVSDVINEAITKSEVQAAEA
ncbi:MAG: cell division ATP-binding protein FtsE [Hydrogenoanaerobacterium sp.]